MTIGCGPPLAARPLGSRQLDRAEGRDYTGTGQAKVWNASLPSVPFARAVSSCATTTTTTTTARPQSVCGPSARDQIESHIRFTD